MSAKPTKSLGQRPDYGIDAPGVRRGMLIAGAAGLLLATAAFLARELALFGAGVPSVIAAVLAGLGVFSACYGLFMGGYMTYSSQVGKLRTREELLDQVAQQRPWQGNDTILDVGCGRGLMVIGAAHRLSAEQGAIAVGIDLWRSEDQADNSPEAALENAQIEGVAGRVRIDTGDARALPYADQSFDVVLSHWVVHNLPEVADRVKVLDEMLRVLRPGGVIALADIAFVASYRAHLLSHGIANVRFLDGGLEARVMGVLSGGSFRPQALVAKRG